MIGDMIMKEKTACFTGHRDIPQSELKQISKAMGYASTDALGEAKVKIKSADGTTYTGRGVSTDVIKASIKAYLGAVNKWSAQKD